MTNQKLKQDKHKINSSNQNRNWVIGAMVLTLILLFFYVPTLKFDFVNWDDSENVYENQNVINFDLEGIFSDHVIGNYNPLTILTFALEYKLVKDKPGLYHFNNMLLHILCTLLVLVLLRQLGMSFFVSILVTLLFGIHPMHVESVAWVTERKDVLFGAFYLLALLFYISYYKTQKILYLLASLFVFGLSLLSKIQAVALPLAIILIDYWFSGKISFKSVLAKTPYFLMSLITGLAGIYFLRQQGSLEVGTLLPLYQRVFIGSYSYVVYILKSFIPFETTALYPYPSTLNAFFYLSILPALAIFLFALKVWKTHRFFTFGVLFFTFNIMFLLQVVGAGQGFLADRFSYIPYIGLFLVFAVLIEKALKYCNRYKPVVYVLIAFYLIGLTVVSKKQIKVWENSETLWTDVIKKKPTVALAYNNLGHYYRRNNEYNKALVNYNQAIHLEPGKAITYNNRGKIYFDRNEIEPALNDFNKCLNLDPTFVNALANRGSVYGLKKEYDKALADLSKALDIEPNNTDALSNRGYVYFQLEQFDKTISDYEKYLKLKPNDADIVNTIGLCYANQKLFDKAISEYNRCIQINPKQGIFFMNRSYAYNGKNDFVNALNDAQNALKLGLKVNENYMKYLNDNLNRK